MNEENIKEIYAVVNGDCGNMYCQQVIALFSTEEKAQEYCDNINGNFHVLKKKIDDYIVPKEERLWTVVVSRWDCDNAFITECSVCANDSDERFFMMAGINSLNVIVSAHNVKEASEKAMNRAAEIKKALKTKFFMLELRCVTTMVNGGYERHYPTYNFETGAIVLPFGYSIHPNYSCSDIKTERNYKMKYL